jgi:hypothetical protein
MWRRNVGRKSAAYSATFEHIGEGVTDVGQTAECAALFRPTFAHRWERLVGAAVWLLGFAGRQIGRRPVRRMAERQTTRLHGGARPTIGLVASLLAVCCQILLLATMSLAPLDLVGDPLGSVPICHLADGTQPAQQTPVQPAHRCALCAICLAHALPSAILARTPTLPDRQSITIVRLDAARPRAPPIRLVAAAQPRGPPSLI